jgi:hypothetical protein
MLEPNVGADTPKRELSVDPPRDGIGDYRIVANAANAVNGRPYESETERFKGEDGGWKSRRVLAPSLEKRRNVVTL